MGKPMTATPTCNAIVRQGGAKPPQNRCHTTPPLKGGGGGGARNTCLGVWWGNDLVPMPLSLSGGEAAVRAYAFALCGLGVLR